ncbi:MAG: GNAT family N-acetyltransferase [Intestinibacillus sp.]
MSFIPTARLLLRPMTEADAPAVYAYAKNPAVGPNAGWKPHQSLLETESLMQSIFLSRRTVWGIVLREGNHLIGSIGLTPDPARKNNRIRMLGYSLAAERWGRGYMTEAARAVLAHGFGTLSLDLISATCFPNNARSRRVLEKCGFVYEGRLRRAERLWNDEVRDLLCFSIAREEFRVR